MSKSKTTLAATTVAAPSKYPFVRGCFVNSNLDHDNVSLYFYISASHMCYHIRLSTKELKSCRQGSPQHGGQPAVIIHDSKELT